MNKHLIRTLAIIVFTFAILLAFAGCSGEKTDADYNDQKIIEHYGDLGFKVNKIEPVSEINSDEGYDLYDVKVTMTTNKSVDQIKSAFATPSSMHFGYEMFPTFIVQDDHKKATILDINGDIYEMDPDSGYYIVTKNGELFAAEEDYYSAMEEEADEDEEEDYDTDDDSDYDSDDDYDSSESSSSGVSHFDICYFIIDRQDYYASIGGYDGDGVHDSFAEAQSHFGITYDQVIEAWTDYDANMSAMDAYY